MLALADPPDTATALLEELIAVAGAGAVLTGPAAEPYVTDVYRRLEQPIAVVRPAAVETLAAVVRWANDAEVAIFPRGGGASYTDGYLPTRARSIVVDLGRLDRVVEINEADAYVTVQAGVTWAALKAALDPLGLRTPFFGPFSGLNATVGGSMSQHSLSHGSGAHGISAQSALGLEVVIASGEIVRTGSAARGLAPFARYSGPDMAGLFLGDCGALGIKARITLPLLKQNPAHGCASFAFADFDGIAGAMRRMALEGLDDEHFALDAALAQGQIARQDDATSVIATARAVMAAAPSPVAGLVTLARMGLAGTRSLREAAYTLHVIVEGPDRDVVRSKLKRLREITAPGWPIANTLPTVVRATPFAPMFNVLGPSGERWVPLHGVMPHSRVAGFHEALVAFYRKRADDMRRLGVWSGGMFETVNSSGFLYEIALYWPGARNAHHNAVVPPDYLAGLPSYADAPEVNAFVETLKADLIALYGEHGAVHFQLGKMYPYAADLEPGALALVKAVKTALDPKGLMNPGALGL
jgi:FAD/FMN-containing dehydrogenase